jgi:type I restriction enzyme S subunit
VSIADLNQSILRTTKELISEAAVREVMAGRVAEPGTLLLSFKLTIGKVSVLSMAAAHNEAIVAVLPNADRADRDYLFYALQALNYARLKDTYVFGATLNMKKLGALPIPLPPLAEQRTTANILRTVQQAKEATEHVIAAARELRRVLATGLFDGIWGREVDGDLETSGATKQFRAVQLGSVASISTGTTPSTARPDYFEGNTPYIRTAEIANNIIRRARTWVSDEAVSDYRLKVYPRGTVFLAMYGQGKTRGQAALLDLEAATSQNTAAIIAGQDLDPRYLWNYLLSRYEALRSDGMQGHISHLNLGFVERLLVPLPALERQREIASLLSVVDEKIEAEARCRDALMSLFETLLDDLMSGRLRASVSDPGAVVT